MIIMKTTKPKIACKLKVTEKFMFFFCMVEGINKKVSIVGNLMELKYNALLEMLGETKKYIFRQQCFFTGH